MIAVEVNLVENVTKRIRESVSTSARGDFYQLSCQAMSTPVNISCRAPTAAVADQYQQLVVQWLASFEARYSRFLSGSIIGQINSAAGSGWLDVDDETTRLLNLCDQMFRITRGTFDAATLPLLKLWNWKSESPRIPKVSETAAALNISGWAKIELRDNGIRLPILGMGIDLGGIGKEYAVDQLLQMAQSFGLLDVLIDIGQDIRVQGKSPGKEAWYIGLEEPEAPGECWTSVAVTNHAVATSGDYARRFEIDEKRYGHIIDPRTGEPVDNNCQSVTVIAPTCVEAGVLSTAAFILGVEDGLELIRSHRNAEACITTTTARHQTRRFANYVPA